MGSLLLPFNPLINSTNANPSFYRLQLLLEAVPYLQLQTILVTYVIITIVIILGFFFLHQTFLSVLMDLKTKMHMILLITHDALLLIRNTRWTQRWMLPFLILESDNPLYMDLSLLIMTSDTPLLLFDNTLIDIFNSCTYSCGQYTGIFKLGQEWS